MSLRDRKAKTSPPTSHLRLIDKLLHPRVLLFCRLPNGSGAGFKCRFATGKRKPHRRPLTFGLSINFCIRACFFFAGCLTAAVQVLNVASRQENENLTADLSPSAYR